MSIWPAIKAGFGSIISPIAEPFKIAQERKKEAIILDKEIQKINAEARREAARNGQVEQKDWDRIALENSAKSWKDEVLMILMYFPVGALFVCAMFWPEKVPIIKEAVSALEDFPVWYQIILWGILAFVFGLRWLIQPLIVWMERKYRNRVVE
ncbi:hypothetical protein CR164_00455 [Prosthecochloris marina]|uniref:Uncharacterized protein n=1 Tax=Prosthecochloris marina TaxID=2017681 RepID=A0A317T8J8_9CHLB|nr:hypothetical protein [Prosthecochloris marina]PWW83069.1 hypothetical protein CR164_00455 [Prosthecochloris marina]